MKLLSVLRLCTDALSFYLILIIVYMVLWTLQTILSDERVNEEFSNFQFVNRKENPLGSRKFQSPSRQRVQTILSKPKKLSQGLKKKITVNLATVACGNVQLVTNMLKTAVLFSQDVNLHVIIFSDEETMPKFKFEMIPLLKQGAKKYLEADFTHEIHAVSFPVMGDGIDWRRMYLNCTNQRLFFPSLLPHIDSLIYLDTDTLVMGNLSDFWTEFSRMDELQLAATSQNTEYLHVASIYNPFRGHPYFGPRGLNAGVMLMNLTRMRAFQLEKKAVEVYKKHNLKITLADQDILNILFNKYPQFMMPMSCIYNFNWIHCPWKTEENEGKQICWHSKRQEPVCFCHDIYTRGVYIIHGNYGSFFKTLDYSGKSMFPWIYRIWHEYHFGDPLDEFLLKMELHYQKYECFMSGRHLIQNAHSYFMNLNLLQLY